MRFAHTDFYFLSLWRAVYDIVRNVGLSGADTRTARPLVERV